MEPVPNPDLPAVSNGDLAATYCATLVDEWVHLGLRHAVVAPGSRSTPMALALAAEDRLEVHVHHDERSAAFMALGIGLRTGEPALVLCTSGTAAVELHPAVVEAHQAGVPMLVVTADRPPELQGVGAPQTIDQRELYGSSVRWYCEPGAPEPGGAEWWRDLAVDAWARTGGAPPGPVHLNLAFREPLVGTPGELPPPTPRSANPSTVRAVGPGWNLPDEELGRLLDAVSGRRGVVVAGARAGSRPEDRDALLALAEQLGWPVLAEPTSGCRTSHRAVVAHFDPVLRQSGWAEALRPEFVLRVGGLVASKVTAQWLATSGALQVGLDRFGLVPDPDHQLARSLTADVAEVCRRLAAASPAPAPDGWSTTWRSAEADAAFAIADVFDHQFSLTEPGTVVAAAERVAPGALVVSSSMPVRDLEWFAAPRNDLTAYSNRGANGIDGVTSTAVGVALTGVPTALLVGDVAFLHDTNALLGLAGRDVDLCIVVVDNGGGGIFSFLPQRSSLDTDRFEQLFGTPHDVDLVELARVHGLPAQRVGTREGLRAAVVAHAGRPRVVVVGTGDRDHNVAAHDAINAAVADALGTPG